MILSTYDRDSFCRLVWDFYDQNGRSFAWRETSDPYRIVLSEIMLQQTQTERAKQFYERFIARFPTWEVLAGSARSDVLVAWQGLGYNRRAVYMHQIAIEVVARYGGIVPADPVLLQQFSGIGPNTAGSICAFVFNKPVVFVETNVRAVFIHHFFADRSKIADRELLPLVAQTLDQDRPRDWYYALMDYGVHIKKMHKNPANKSSNYARQSKFKGSRRQVRGAILRLLSQVTGHMLEVEFMAGQLALDLGCPPQLVREVVEELAIEGLVRFDAQQAWVRL